MQVEITVYLQEFSTRLEKSKGDESKPIEDKSKLISFLVCKSIAFDLINYMPSLNKLECMD